MTVKELLIIMDKVKASDLYMTVDAPPMFRIEGVTRPYGESKFTPHQTEDIAQSLLTERQKSIFSETMEMNVGIYYPELGRFRVNMYRQKSFVGIVFRRIKLDIDTLDDLQMPPVLKDICLAKRGLVLIVGGTGTGKSTTLAAMIDHRSSMTTGHIITVEDPIEFLYPHRKCIVSQREIGIDTFSYAEALKNTLRQAPDVILIGEIRDRETMESAIIFSETGHLCMSTLHANNANQAIERIMNFFPPEKHLQFYFQLSFNMRAIISQRLIPTIEGKRIAAMEILLDSPRAKDLIMKRKIDILKEVMQESTAEGMQTFDQSLFALLKAGKISYDNAIAYSDSANDLRLRIKMEEVAGESTKQPEKSKKTKLTDGENSLRLK